MALRLRSPQFDARVTAALREVRPLKARERGDLVSALASAAYYAKKGGRTMFVFETSSGGKKRWRVSCKSFQYCGKLHNFGDVAYEVTRDLVVRRWQVEGRAEKENRVNGTH